MTAICVFQVLKAPPNFVFRAVSGPLVYTAVSIINTLRQSARSTSSSTLLTVTPIYTVPENINQVHSGSYHIFQDKNYSFVLKQVL